MNASYCDCTGCAGCRDEEGRELGDCPSEGLVNDLCPRCRVGHGLPARTAEARPGERPYGWLLAHGWSRSEALGDEGVNGGRGDMSSRNWRLHVALYNLRHERGRVEEARDGHWITAAELAARERREARVAWAVRELLKQRTRVRRVRAEARQMAIDYTKQPLGEAAPRSANPRHSSESAERFWSKVDRSGGLEVCWPWTAARQPIYREGHDLPYGHYKIGGKKGRLVLAHRHAYELTHGPIPTGLIIRHLCDNPPCCNPKHLAAGTQKENVADAIARARHSFPNPRHSSDSTDHYTPPEIVGAAIQTMGGIDTDPASCERAQAYVEADQFFTVEDDGFNRPWRGRVFLNPPGGLCDARGRRVIPKSGKAESCRVTGACGLPPGHAHEGVQSSAKAWWFKAVRELAAGNATELVYVGFSLEILQTTQVDPPDLEWLEPVPSPVPLDFAVCYPKARLRYLSLRDGRLVPGGQPTYSSFVCYVGPNIGGFFDAFSAFGRVVVPDSAMDAYRHLRSIRVREAAE